MLPGKLPKAPRYRIMRADLNVVLSLAKWGFPQFLPFSKEKNSVQRYPAVLSSKSFIKQRESTSCRKDESRLFGNQKQAWNRVGLNFLEWWFLLVSCIDKFFDSFRLYNFLLGCKSSPISTQAKPKGVGRETKTAMLIYYRYDIMNLRLP